MFSHPMDAEQLLHRHPVRLRRHRSAGLGLDAAAHVSALLRTQGLSGRSAGTIRRRSRRHQGRLHQGDRRLCLRPPAHRNRRAPPGAQIAVRFRQPPPHLVLQRVRLSGSGRIHRSRDQPRRPAHRHLPRLRRGRPAHQQDRLGGAHHPPARPTSSCNARTTARSTATAPKRWRC